MECPQQAHLQFTCFRMFHAPVMVKPVLGAQCFEDFHDRDSTELHTDSRHFGVRQYLRNGKLHRGFHVSGNRCASGRRLHQGWPQMANAR